MLKTDFNAAAYALRIGLAHIAAPSLSFLRTIVARHVTTIPFENLDIILGRPIRLDIGSVQAKLVDACRGGYCFEQNTLLRAALEHLGFTVGSMMARVVRGVSADAITSKTHMLLRVDLPEGAYLVDVGFGNLTPTAPLMLGNIDVQATEHENYRLQPMGRETLLKVRVKSEWENVYRFTGQPSFPIDHEVCNWFTSSNPLNLFTNNMVAARPAANARKTLFNQELTIHGENTDRFTIHDETMLQDVLSEHFGIDLDPAERAAIFTAMRQFAERGEAGFRFS
jgi:N-hydroxyarylamine O-acetyltransferase